VQADAVDAFTAEAGNTADAAAPKGLANGGDEPAPVESADTQDVGR